MSDRQPARGIFDIRLHVEAPTEEAAEWAVAETARLAQFFAPAGVKVAWHTLRPPTRAKSFKANMRPEGWRPRERRRR